MDAPRTICAFSYLITKKHSFCSVWQRSKWWKEKSFITLTDNRGMNPMTKRLDSQTYLNYKPINYIFFLIKSMLEATQATPAERSTFVLFFFYKFFLALHTYDIDAYMRDVENATVVLFWYFTFILIWSKREQVCIMLDILLLMNAWIVFDEI